MPDRKDKRPKQARHDREGFARALFDRSPIGIQIFGADGTLLETNTAQRQLADRAPRASEAPLNVLTDPAFAETELGAAFRRAYAGEVVEIPEVTVTVPDAHGLPLRAFTLEQVLFPIRDDGGAVQAVVSFCQDVSERRDARDAQRLESLGVLAGSLAHGLNNLLAAMLAHLSVATAKLAPDHEVRESLVEVRKAVERAADLTRQMLAYAGRGAFHVAPLDLTALLRDNLALIQAAVPQRARLVMHLASELPPISADAGQMRQVLLNLITNAAEALGDREGAVRVTTGTRDIREGADDLSRLTGRRLRPGRYVTLEVSDDGSGMDVTTVARMFEPFFSTKTLGRGLGLSAVLGIVRAHGGGMSVDSRVGQGTTITVALPTVSAPIPVPPAAVPRPAAGLPTGTVLLLDDEELVRTATAGTLQDAGFRVLLARDGGDGLALYRQRASEIDVVILDLSMPGMAPVDTLRELRAVNPEVRVLLTSGYAEEEARRGLEGVAGFLRKPTPVEEFVDAVRAAMARPARR